MKQTCKIIFILSLIISILCCIALPSYSNYYSEYNPEIKKETSELGLQYEDYGYGYVIVGYTGNTINLVIPSLYKGKEVVAIGESAFESNGVLKSIKIPYTVKKINAEAFRHCYNLERVSFDRNSELNYIDKLAFFHCFNLKEITLSNRLYNFGLLAFYDCINLENVYFYGTLEEWKSITYDYYNKWVQVDSELMFADESAHPMYYADNLFLYYGTEWKLQTDYIF